MFMYGNCMKNIKEIIFMHMLGMGCFIVYKRKLKRFKF